ncbi:hypothetical protein TUBRATIS_24360 [Tubulinosema ratisbonensis]|uniref:Uncharacterized protein n=1 Tax=Tubulinosema ratisbonensis TaxID=291195 RepID=A0A437AJ58_9MICR|nr:hypothetical protein TUBRATIS_24360 [Tubulinosema ratisbonensis]
MLLLLFCIRFIISNPLIEISKKAITEIIKLNTNKESVLVAFINLSFLETQLFIIEKTAKLEKRQEENHKTITKVINSFIKNVLKKQIKEKEIDNGKLNLKKLIKRLSDYETKRMKKKKDCNVNVVDKKLLENFTQWIDFYELGLDEKIIKKRGLDLMRSSKKIKHKNHIVNSKINAFLSKSICISVAFSKTMQVFENMIQLMKLKEKHKTALDHLSKAIKLSYGDNYLKETNYIESMLKKSPVCKNSKSSEVDSATETEDLVDIAESKPTIDVSSSPKSETVVKVERIKPSSCIPKTSNSVDLVSSCPPPPPLPMPLKIENKERPDDASSEKPSENPEKTISNSQVSDMVKKLSIN